MQKAIEAIIVEAAIKFNLDKQIIALVLDSQFRFCRNTIKDSIKDYTADSLPIIMLPKFGKFVPNKLKYSIVKAYVDNKRKNGK